VAALIFATGFFGVLSAIVLAEEIPKLFE